MSVSNDEAAAAAEQTQSGKADAKMQKCRKSDERRGMMQSMESSCVLFEGGVD